MASVAQHSPQQDFKGVKAMMDDGLSHVPQKYIRSSSDRPSPAQVFQSDSIPVIDLAALNGDGRDDVLHQIRFACRDWGFFQLINHGVSQDVVDKMRTDLESFFQQPAEERMRFFTENPLGGEVVYMSSASRGKEKICDWMDSLRFRPLALESEGYNSGPECCRDAAIAFYKEMRSAGVKLSEAIGESLGLKLGDDLQKLLGGEGALAISANYYPACPDPSLTLGLSGHSDANAFTIVFQDEVGGLQVRKDDRWVVVQPVPGALVVNVGDVIEILSNGYYKSIEHRVVTNSSKPRMSMVCFFGPAGMDVMIEPQPQFVEDPNGHLFRPVAFGELLQAFFREALPGKSHLSTFYLK